MASRKKVLLWNSPEEGLNRLVSRPRSETGFGTLLKSSDSVCFLLPSLKITQKNTYTHTHTANTDFTYHIPTSVWLISLMHPFFAYKSKHTHTKSCEFQSFLLGADITVITSTHTYSWQLCSLLQFPKKAQRMLTNPVFEGKNKWWCRQLWDITWSKYEIARPWKQNSCACL